MGEPIVTIIRSMPDQLPSATTGAKWIERMNVMDNSPTIDEIPGTLVDLNTIEELRSAFNRDKGIPRLILLFSPT